MATAGQHDILQETRIEKAASDAGFDITPAREGGWLAFRSTAFPHSLAVSAQPAGNYRVGFSDADWGQKAAGDCAHSVEIRERPWPARVDSVVDYDALHRLLIRAATIGRLLAGERLELFKVATRKLPESTEADRLVVQRVGQDIFRSALIEYWRGHCAVTGLAVLPLLRASHAKPWAVCESDDERLDVFNGLLLAPHLDALFDGGWITFSDGGEVLVSRLLPADAYLQLCIRPAWRLDVVANSHKPYFAYHRAHVFRES